MKTATIRQIRNDFGTVLRWVESGEEVTVLKRRTVVARICPPRAGVRDGVKMPDFAARARAIFGRKKTHLTDAVLRERETSRW
jgi:antitoxin (DNA-binding transcriptional repressor) of toxin-antitoxin stability system